MNAHTTTSVALDTNELQKLSGLPTDLALQQAAPFLAHLVKDPIFLEAEILAGCSSRWRPDSVDDAYDFVTPHPLVMG